jgi:hypothetical protein
VYGAGGAKLGKYDPTKPDLTRAIAHSHGLFPCKAATYSEGASGSSPEAGSEKSCLPGFKGVPRLPIRAGGAGSNPGEARSSMRRKRQHQFADGLHPAPRREGGAWLLRIVWRPFVLTGLSVTLLVVRIAFPGWFGAGPPSMSAPHGFAADTVGTPHTGSWFATGTTTSSVGYSNDAPGSTVQRLWTITRSCTPTCTFTLTRSWISDNVVSVIRTRLFRRSDGWHATWPPTELIRGYSGRHPIYWSHREVWILRFGDRGTVARADASTFSENPRCGYGKDSITWHATYINPPTKTSSSATG